MYSSHTCCVPPCPFVIAGIIDLKTCSKVTNRENMRGFKHVFDVCTSDRNYHLVAESDVDKRTWIETINTTLFTASSSSPVPPPDTQQQQQVRAAAKSQQCNVFVSKECFSSQSICHICCFQNSSLLVVASVYCT